MLQDLLNTPIFGGQAAADFLTVQVLGGAAVSIVSAIALLFGGFWIASWASRRVRLLGQAYEQLDNTLFIFLGNILRYAIIAFTLSMVMNTFGIRTTSIVALVGAAGLAIGLALQGTLSNIAAGVMIVIFRPMNVGDFVEVGGKMGTVKDISLNYTELASVGNVQIIVPNSEVWGNVITNYSAYEFRRAEWTFGVGYGANLKDAEEIIRKTIMGDARSLTDPEPFIQVCNLNDSSVDFLVRVWVKTGDYFAYQTDMTRRVKEAFDAGGIDIPYPTRTIMNA